MVPIALVNLSNLTTTIMPFPWSALCVCACVHVCVFKRLQLEKCKEGQNNVHKAPETSWGPHWCVPHIRTRIHPGNAFIADITLTLFPSGPPPLAGPQTPHPSHYLLSPFPLICFCHFGVARGLFVSSPVRKLKTVGGSCTKNSSGGKKASHYTPRALYMS